MTDQQQTKRWLDSRSPAEATFSEIETHAPALAALLPETMAVLRNEREGEMSLCVMPRLSAEFRAVDRWYGADRARQAYAQSAARHLVRAAQCIAGWQDSDHREQLAAAANAARLAEQSQQWAPA